MSTHELEMKCRELRQLQALIDEAQAEAETIKDAIKAAMGTQEAVQAGAYKITWKPVTTVRIDATALKKGPAGRSRAVHKRNHGAPVLRGMMEVVVTIAGALYLTNKLFVLVDWIEKKKALPRELGGQTEKDL